VSFREWKNSHSWALGLQDMVSKDIKKLHKESEWRLFTVTSHMKDTHFVKTSQVKNI